MSLKCAFGILLTCTALWAEPLGTLGGTVGFVSVAEHQFVRVAAKSTLLLSHRGKEVTLKADENGDFRASLPPGKYQLTKVLDSAGHELALYEKQARKFTIRANRDTRFDVMVLQRANSSLKPKHQSLASLRKSVPPDGTPWRVLELAADSADDEFRQLALG